MRRSRLFECIFAFSLAARRRSSRYGAVRRKVKRLLAISDLMQAAGLICIGLAAIAGTLFGAGGKLV